MFPKRFPQIVELPDALLDPVVEFVEQPLAASHIARTLESREHIVCLLDRKAQGSEPEDAAQPGKPRDVDQPIIAFGAIGSLDQSLPLELPNQGRTHLVAESLQLVSRLADRKPSPKATGGTEQKKVLAVPVRHLARRTTYVITGANGS